MNVRRPPYILIPHTYEVSKEYCSTSGPVSKVYRELQGNGGQAVKPTEDFDAGSVYDTPSESTLTVQLLWQKAVKVEIPGDRDAGHGGGDRRLLDDIFIGGIDDPLMRAADHVQGAQSILTEIAANIAFATGAVRCPIRTADRAS